ncbi:Gfo/Idh/MocA family oxidoreductase [Halosimplex rubrum]|uniref:Gfo/Idh/MocA family oxidoreductase n=1 Tax=Halosimplex rubrum TaxID=869889 RepID=A0A7D5SQP4_9EURY|nr:Gfo/Idh/MocA family oxidoreductase [Halosimplex rubrum]QLH77867.1 Gfo/Idh/MocA family oxidoreductase [Halosimplex rubrum]
MTYRAIQVGTGGQGGRWCDTFLPPNVEKGLVDVVAAVDVNEAAHENAVEHLGVDPADCYTDAETAFAEHDADFCTVVTPPWTHEEVVDAAVDHDLDILSEKPIADTLEASVRIAEKVERAGLKMGVTMSHRFDRDKTTMRRRLRSGEPGPLDYLVGRFTCNARTYGAWGAFRHDMEHPLLVEGAVHQLDFLADMAGANCERLYADTWLPEWAEYEDDVQATVQMRFENGVRATWEGAKANATTLNGWGSDALRAECRDETLVLDDREIVRYPYEQERETVVGVDDADPEPVPLDEQDAWGNTWLVEQFVEWLDGGEPMATDVESNLQSVALVEAAIESSERDEAVDPQALLAETRESVEL